jgi:hypothetical protein
VVHHRPLPGDCFQASPPNKNVNYLAGWYRAGFEFPGRPTCMTDRRRYEDHGQGAGKGGDDFE